jgi:hypothetical protein
VADLLALKTRIASELHRSDLTTPIASAITSAISFYDTQRLAWNELQASFSTVAQQESYTTSIIPTDIGEVDTLRITVNGRLVVLDPENFTRLQAISTTSASYGQPRMWAWYAQTIFLYPVPDAVYSILISYQQKLSAPTGDSDDTTVWTNQAEALIRHRTKKLLCRDVLRDSNGFQAAQDAENEELANLKRDSLQLQDVGGLQPNW